MSVAVEEDMLEMVETALVSIFLLLICFIDLTNISHLDVFYFAFVLYPSPLARHDLSLAVTFPTVFCLYLNCYTCRKQYKVNYQMINRPCSHVRVFSSLS